jgi:hypothetical protein
MKEEKLKELLNELSDATVEPVHSSLAEDIKQQIPQQIPHKKGSEGVHIVINVRISKLAAAAVIIVTIFLSASLFGGRDWTSDGIVNSIRESLAWLGAGGTDVLAVKLRYEELVQQGEDVVYYGDRVEVGDGSAVLLQQKLPSGEYSVFFGDGSAKTVSAEELVELLSGMVLREGK